MKFTLLLIALILNVTIASASPKRPLSLDKRAAGPMTNLFMTCHKSMQPKQLSACYWSIIGLFPGAFKSSRFFTDAGLIGNAESLTMMRDGLLGAERYCRVGYGFLPREAAGYDACLANAYRTLAEYGVLAFEGFDKVIQPFAPSFTLNVEVIR